MYGVSEFIDSNVAAESSDKRRDPALSSEFDSRFHMVKTKFESHTTNLSTWCGAHNISGLVPPMFIDDLRESS